MDVEYSPLLLAARHRHKDTVELLINAGANIEGTSILGNRTVLHFASESGWLEIVQTLLEKGADVQVKTIDGVSPLLLAAENRHKNIVGLLLKAGANIEGTGILRRTVLHYASKNGWLEIVQTLLEKGADVQVKSINGVSPLLLAAENRHKNIVGLLLNAGANIEGTSILGNWTVLHYASESGWLEIVQTLLEKGADVQVKTMSGTSPLLLAARHRHKDTVELLINAGANIEGTSRGGNWTVLHYASENGWLEIVQTLLEKGADVQVKTINGVSPLLLAARMGHKNIVELLIKAGAYVNAGSFEENSPMSILLRELSDIKFLDYFRLLIQNGAYLQSNDYERIIGNSLLKEQILKDSELCSQLIINEFNHKDLTELNKQLTASNISLGNIENMRIGNKSQVAHEILQRVIQEIQKKGYCNVLQVPFKGLKILSVKSFLSFCANKKWDSSLNPKKRSTEWDDIAHSSKRMHFN